MPSLASYPPVAKLPTTFLTLLSSLPCFQLLLVFPTLLSVGLTGHILPFIRKDRRTSFVTEHWFSINYFDFGELIYSELAEN